jgi:hypothetical protein
MNVSHVTVTIIRSMICSRTRMVPHSKKICRRPDSNDWDIWWLINYYSEYRKDKVSPFLTFIYSVLFYQTNMIFQEHARGTPVWLQCSLFIRKWSRASHWSGRSIEVVCLFHMHSRLSASHGFSIGWHPIPAVVFTWGWGPGLPSNAEREDWYRN